MELPRSAYVHIPFCRRRCYYCDFPVSVLGDYLRGENSGTVALYVTLLEQEINLTSGPPLETVFFGGGTPSLLTPEQVGQILAALDRRCGLAKGAEISLEMDPGTFSAAQVRALVALGVNRVSLGAQSFEPQLLQLLGRTHTVADIYTARELLERGGCPNVNLDLMSGLPHQTLPQWRRTLRAALALAPAHLSTYDLSLEPGTAFSRRYQAGVAPLPPDQTAADMYRLASETIRAVGFEHYEVSNYARPGYQCRHNRVYWENRPFYGFGMGATSYLQGRRQARPRTVNGYRDWVLAGAPQTAPVTEPLEQVMDTLMLGLRLREGLTLGQLPAPVLEHLHRVRQRYPQWLELLPPDRIRLRDPEGFLFSNTVLTELFGADLFAPQLA